MTIPRFLVEDCASNAVDVRLEAAKLILCESIQKAEHFCANKVTLIVPEQRGFSGTHLGKVLGDQVVKVLNKGETFQINDGRSFDLITYRQAQRGRSCNFEVVIGAYLSPAGLDVLDSITSAKAISFIPNSEVEGRKWQSIWSPTVWGASTWKEPSIKIPVEIEEELQHLTRTINLSSGIVHPSDKNSAVNTINKIKGICPNVCREDVKCWAIKIGWEPRHARELSRLIR
ncbi:MAG: hypothetical protein K0U19_05345 [Proteobacteria bacterium]|nr:hypothetical protein [Pseudomonadota bacterium]